MITVAILTISDSTASGLRVDESGPALRKLCETFGWSVITSQVVSDDIPAISSSLQAWADRGIAQLLLSTGGTGVSSRDITPEATRPLLDKEIPGLGELMRREGQQQTPLAVLSRSLAGTRAKSLIVNLPGSPKGAVHSLQIIQPFVPHIIDLLQGVTEHSDNKPSVKETQRNA